MFAVYFEGTKKIAERIAATNRQCTPPVCQELACRTISHILPQNRLTIILLSNSGKSKGVGLCLPQSTPNLILCCNKAALPPPHLVFYYLVLLLCPSFRKGGKNNDREGTRNFLSPFSVPDYRQPKTKTNQRNRTVRKPTTHSYK